MPTARYRPDFLVIGAMKSGTTSLYHDLYSHPDIFLPDKESNLLFAPSPADAFTEAYKKSQVGQICGEVCPDYSKLPDLSDALPAAKKLFTDQMPRLIYLVRQPLNRTLSHHRFVSSRRDTRFPTMDANINQCLDEHPELINYSRYAMQIRPWIEAFGKKSLLVIRFEDYIQNRNDTLKKIHSFLGLSNAPLPPTHQDRIHNRSASRPVLTPAWQRIIESKLYRQLLRPLLSLSLRDKIRRRVLPTSSNKRTPLTAETQQAIIDQVRDDSAELPALLDLDAPLWNLNQTENQ